MFVDNDKNFKGLFYQDQDMRDMFDSYPEILLVDATYKLNDLRLPLYVMLVVDGNGESEIVGLMLAADEQQDTVRQMMIFFKELNPQWNKVNCIMADKDMTERQIMKEELPQASLLICLFHTMRTFRREVTTEKMGISNDERLQVLEILQSMAYSKNEAAYQVQYELLLSTRLNPVIEYFNDNWHPIRDEWVEGQKNRHSNFLNSTNNRLESINQKLKAVVSRHSSLLEFNKQLQCCLSSLKVERDHRAASIFHKRPVYFDNLKEDELHYFNTCTPFAFHHIQKQLSLQEKTGKILEKKSSEFYVVESKSGNIQVSPDKCQCAFFTSMHLPCKHIFGLRKQLKYPLYCNSLCDKRWTKDHYFTSHRIFKSCEEEPLFHQVDELPEDPRHTITVGTCKANRVLSQHDKYRKAFEVTQTLASLASEVSGNTFQARMATLKYILQSWQNGKEVHLDIDKERSTYNVNQKNLATLTPVVNANQAEKYENTCIVRPEKDNDEKSIVKEKNEHSQQEKACSNYQHYYNQFQNYITFH